MTSENVSAAEERFREIEGLLLNGPEALATKHIEKSEVLDAFCSVARLALGNTKEMRTVGKS